MNEKTLLKDVAAIKALADRLSECSEVTQHDSGEYREAGVLADGFSDLEEAFRVFLAEHLPKLTNPQVRGEALVDVLQEIIWIKKREHGNGTHNSVRS